MRLWWSTRTECVATLRRLVRERQITLTQESAALDDLRTLLGSVDEIAPTEDVRERAERVLAVHALRAADALQLGAALVWARERPRGLEFVCLDERLRAAARREGFTILP
jgi:uncharacterized protein